MYSNGTEANILRNIAAVHGVANIGEQFDKQSRVLVCAKHHSKVSAIDDKYLS